MKKTVLTLLLGLFVTLSFADEGMWMLNLLKQQNLAKMQAMGLKLQDTDIYNPDGISLKDAVVRFGGGCTGEVISSEGLVLTNHHCGFNQIQSHSSVEHNYLEDGFWAMSKEEELPNPELTVTFVEKIEDVTDFVKASLERDKENDVDGVFFLSPGYLNKLAIELVGEEYLANNKGVEVEIAPFFEGNQYYMFTKKVYSDVRLVGAPPMPIGKFGGDTDNYTWPRHSADFALFRIYADKEGNPAEYSQDNVPLKPKRWFTISTAGVEANDFAMLMGFPGSTNKYYTSWEVEERRDIDNAVRIKMRNIRQEAMMEEMVKDVAVNIQYASKYRSSSNRYKNAIGTNWAIDLRDFASMKKEQQDRLLSWSEQNNKPEYAEAINTIERIVKDRANLRFRRWMLNEGIRLGVEFSRIPLSSITRLETALKQNDSDAIAKYMLELRDDFDSFADKDYNFDVDKKVSKAMIGEYVNQVDYEYLPEAFKAIQDNYEGDVDAYVDYVFENSIFGSEENIERFIEEGASLDKLENDPIINVAKSVRNEYAALNKGLRAYDNEFDKARRDYMKGILEMDSDKVLFPDANRTLRLSYGLVKGYEPRDCVKYGHQTTVEGIMEKEDPNHREFIVPAEFKELYENKNFGNYHMSNGKMPVNFVTTSHTTGGNSGSPLLNAKGELIGINFDRNWEGVGGDIQFLPDYQRNISVDIRYILFVIEKYGKAGHLIEELDIN